MSSSSSSGSGSGVRYAEKRSARAVDTIAIVGEDAMGDVRVDCRPRLLCPNRCPAVC